MYSDTFWDASGASALRLVRPTFTGGACGYAPQGAGCGAGCLCKGTNETLCLGCTCDAVNFWGDPSFACDTQTPSSEGAPAR